MFMRKLWPVVVLAGMVLVGCEEYSAPEIKNSGPTLSLTTVTGGSTFTDTIRVAGTTSDDNYTNSLGIYLYNKNEDNSLEYAYGFPRLSLAVKSYNYVRTINLKSSRIVDGDYDLIVRSTDVHGLVDEEKVAITVAAGASNLDSVRYDKLWIFKSTRKDSIHYLSIRVGKQYDDADLKKADRAANVDLVFADLGSGPQIMSPNYFDQTNTAPDSLKGASTSQIAALADTTSANFTLQKTSTELRTLFSAQASNDTKQPLTPGAAYILKTSTNLYVYLKVRVLTADQIQVEVKHKRFYP